MKEMVPTLTNKIIEAKKYDRGRWLGGMAAAALAVGSLYGPGAVRTAGKVVDGATGVKYTQSDLSKMPQKPVALTAQNGINKAIFAVDKELGEQGLNDVQDYVDHQIPEGSVPQPGLVVKVPAVPGHEVGK
ncbi:MAG: hypothetical protein JWL89_124 [Candidatus Saccharibacteria bacterium]|nr:hypothetical protein [Candidatus Saccharibacteria bacterium]